MDGLVSIKSLLLEDIFKYKGLVKLVISFYNVSKDVFNVGVVVYFINVIMEFKFDEYYIKFEVNIVIDVIVFFGDFIRVGNGLIEVCNEFFVNGCSGILNFFVVLMDGVFIDDIFIFFVFFRVMDVYVLVVGIGDFYVKF